MAAVITVFVTAAETFTEIIVVVFQADIVIIVTVSAVLISVIVLVVIIPAVLTVGESGVKAFLVTVIYRVTQHLRAVLAGVVIIASA